MLKKRLIPKLQMMASKIGNDQQMVLVNTVKFTEYSEIGDPISLAKIYQAQFADELIFLNINPQTQSSQSMIEIVKKASSEIFMPITVGGGITSHDYIRELIKNGADRVSINSAGFKNHDFVKSACEIFGRATIVVSIDYKLDENDKLNKVVIDSGKTMTNVNLSDWVKKVADLGAGEILLTSIDNDGSKKGIDFKTGSEIKNLISIPLVLSGGCGIANHFCEAFIETNCSGIAAGNFFSYQDQNLMQTRAHIHNSKIPIRMQL